MRRDMLVTCLCDIGHGIGFYWTCRDIKRLQHKSQRMLTCAGHVRALRLWQAHISRGHEHESRERAACRGQEMFWKDFRNDCGNCTMYHNFWDDVRLVLTGLPGCWVNTCHDTRYQTQTFIPGWEGHRGPIRGQEGVTLANEEPG